MDAAGGGGVFVSYRREDGSDTAGRIADRLTDAFGKKRVFIDVDAIGPGTDYVDALTRAVGSCDVLVAIIGRRWLTIKNKQGRRLDDPRDWVRVEVGTALARGVRVIPVLTGGAAMPTREKLPDDLAGLARLNALRIRHESFHPDATRLVTAIGLGTTAATPTPANGTAARARTAPARGGPAAAARKPVAAARKTAKVSRSDPGRAARLFDDAERIANAITTMSDKAQALGYVAAAVAAVDPGRATRLFDEVDRVANRLKKYERGWALRCVVEAMAAVDPDRAERIAYTVRDESRRKDMLGYVAMAVAATDPVRAEHLVPAITGWINVALVMKAMAAVDPDRAERIASTMTRSHDKDSALSGVAAAVAAIDPGRAERIANTIEDTADKASALSYVAAAMAAANPDRASQLFDQAESIARSAPYGKYGKGTGLRGVATAMATVNPDRAERIANSITYKPAKEEALHNLAAAVAATDPDNAERIAKTMKGGSEKAETMRDVATAIAVIDPDRAERIANSIANEYWPEAGKSVKAAALANIAKAIISA
jgi:TIR domain